MSLLVHLPLTGNLENKGLANVTVTNNGATVDDNGKIGKCYSFSNNSIMINYALPATEHEWSYCCWAKLNNNSEAMCLYSSRTLVNSAQRTIFLLDNKGVYFDDGTRISGTLNTTATLTNWCHYAFSRSSNKINIYVNGSLAFSSSITAFPSSVSTNTFFGASQNSNTTVNAFYLAGSLNDIRIYDHALSPKEIKEISNGLVCHYPLNDPYVESTTNLLNYNNLTGWGSSWTLLEETFNNTPVYRNVVTSPSVQNNAGFSIIRSITDSNLVSATKITLSFYKKLNSVYGVNLRGYIRVVKSDDTTQMYNWSYNKPNWANDQNSIGIWDYIYATVTIPTGCKRISNLYVYVDLATGGSCDFAKIQLEFKDHPTPYVDGTRSNIIVYDTSGYNNDGTVTGTLSLSNDSPRYGYSTSFSGNSMIKSNDINLRETSNFTISCWVYRTGSQNYQPAFWFGNGNVAQGIAIHGPNVGRVEGSDGNNNKFDASGSGISADVWTHVVLTYNGNTITKYLNGIQKNIISYSSGFGNTLNRLYIGYFWGGYFNGKISDVRIYTTTLSADDIKELYDTSAFITDNGTTECYEFDEIDDELSINKNGIMKIGNLYENDAQDYSEFPSGKELDTEQTKIGDDYITSNNFIEI